MGRTARPFPKSYRLSKPSEYRRVRDATHRSADRNFVVLARANDLPHPRLGITVSRRRLARAVDRNRIKRLIRETFRERQAALTGLDVVVILRGSVGTMTNRELAGTLLRHWDRLIPCDPS